MSSLAGEGPVGSLVVDGKATSSWVAPTAGEGSTRWHEIPPSTYIFDSFTVAIVGLVFGVGHMLFSSSHNTSTDLTVVAKHATDARKRRSILAGKVV